MPSAPVKVQASQLETEGNRVATSFHHGHPSDKRVAVRCWQAVVDASGLNDKVLAHDAGMSRGHYSKVASGEQGDLLGLVYKVGAKYPEMRVDFFARLTEAESVNPVQSAAEQLAVAALRYLRLSAALPSRHRVAKADIASASEKKTVSA